MIILRAFAVVLLIATGVVCLEWLFFVTQPSFMSLYSPWEKIGVAGSTSAIVFAGLALLTLPFVVVAAVLARIGVPRAAVSVVAVFPAILLLTFGILVLIENFSQTLFGWGIRNASGGMIYVYRMSMIALLVLAARFATGLMVGQISEKGLRRLTIASALVVATGLPWLIQAIPDFFMEQQLAADHPADLPNILVLTGDGVSASHMSVYGYQRPTTPFLESVADEFLIAENHFSNAADTGGSVISMLTGKLPTTTRMIYPPDVLRGHHSYQHLPGFLKAFGYYNADISIRHYADPYDLNLRNGYSEANFRNLEESAGIVSSTVRKIQSLNPASQLIDRISERITDRYDHVWKNKNMPNPLAEVGEPDHRWISDKKRLQEIARLIRSGRQPFFLTVHLMGTHGAHFRPRQRMYSSEADYKKRWNVDAYDDAVIDFDDDARKVYELLREEELLETTVLIISSDHGFRHGTLSRVPMMMRLPQQASTGAIDNNTQRIDIAPTVLEILGLTVPGWMEGRSMLVPVPEDAAERPIFAANSHLDKTASGNFWSLSHYQAPWYSLGRVNLVYCDQGFAIRLEKMEFITRNIEGSTRECEKSLSGSEARAMMLDHLREKGYGRH